METVTRLTCVHEMPWRFLFLLFVTAAFLAPGQLRAATPPCTLNSTQPSVTICTPAANATVSSPVHVAAGSNSSPAATLIQIYLDGSKVYQVAGAQLDTNITTTAGTHRLTVQAYNGTYFKSTISITDSGVTVTVQPSSATIVPGAQQQFNATVQGSTDTSVTWSVDNVSGGNATVGTISTSGMYTAPSTTGNHVVKATSVPVPSASGTANVSVQTTTDGRCVPNPAQPSVTICSPAPNSTVASPLHVVAQSNSSPPAKYVQVYLDGSLKSTVQGTSLDTTIATTAGTHRLTVQANNGTTFKTTEFVTATTTPPQVSVSVSPPSATIMPNATQQFTATVSNSSNTAVDWSVDTVAGGNATVGTVSSSGLYTAPPTNGSHTVTATSQADTTKSGSASVTVSDTPPPPPPTFAGVFTYKNNNARHGANLAEGTLKPANVSSATFGKDFTYTVDGHVYAQPLYVPGLSIGGKTRDVVFVATEHNSVYAFDADGNPITALWKRSFLDTANGVTAIPTADVGSTVNPEIGITGTPVIDPATNTLYVVAATKETSGSTVTYVQRLHALDLITGAEKLGGPVTISGSVPGVGDGSVNGVITFDAKLQLQRPALLLDHGVVYIAWASHGDHGLYHGWVMGYDATTLQQTMIFNATPNGRRGGIWQSGGGLASDDAGNIYFETGNGTFNADRGGTEHGDSFIKLSPSGQILDYFAPFDQAYDNSHDLDIGVGGPLVLPDQPGPHPHLITGAGKDHRIYLLDRDNMGHFRAGADTQIVQEIPDILASHCHEQPPYWNGNIYYSAELDAMHQMAMNNGQMSQVAKTTTVFNGGDNVGTNPSVSANGTTDGIVWAIEKNSSGNAILHAYDATNIQVELYNSTQAGTRDALGNSNKYTPPTIANGKVFVPLNGKVAVFGPLN